MEHAMILTVDETKIRSIRVDDVGVTRVGSETICVRLNEDTTDISLWYKGVVISKKFMLKSPTK